MLCAFVTDTCTYENGLSIGLDLIYLRIAALLVNHNRRFNRAFFLLILLEFLFAL